MTDLVPTSSGIIAEHQEIIAGYECIYGLLVDLGFVQNTDVQVPPHGMPKDPIAVAPLRAAGLDPGTIELIGRLPCFSNEIIEIQRDLPNDRDGIPIAPFSSATSYLLGSGRHDEAREVGIGPVGGEELLPPTAFKMTSTSDPEGYNLAYDLNTKTVLKWHPDGWSKCQRIPVSDFLAEWTEKLRSLEWLPWKDDMGWEMEVKQTSNAEDLADPQSPIQEDIKANLVREKSDRVADGNYVEPIENIFAQYLVSNRVARDRYWARRRIYEECGWPQNFNQELFLQQQEKWNTKVKELAASNGTENCTGDVGTNKELRDFYRTTSGEHA